LCWRLGNGNPGQSIDGFVVIAIAISGGRQMNPALSMKSKQGNPGTHFFKITPPRSPVQGNTDTPGDLSAQQTNGVALLNDVVDSL